MTGIHWLVLGPTHQILAIYCVQVTSVQRVKHKNVDNYKTDDQKKYHGFSVYKKNIKWKYNTP